MKISKRPGVKTTQISSKSTDSGGKKASWFGTAHDYTKLLAWVLNDLIAHYRWRSLYLAAVGGVQILCRYGAMGVLFGFLNHFEQHKQPVLLGIVLPEPRSVAFLVMSTAAGGALLMLAAYFRYELMQRALFIGKAYEKFCLRRLFSLSGRLPHPAAPSASKVIADGSITKFQSYTRQAGRVAWTIGQVLPAAVSLVVAAIILVWLDYRMTLGIALLAVIVTLAQYPANRKAAKASEVLEEYAPQANRRLREILRIQRVSPVPLELDAPEYQTLFRDENVRRFMKGHTNRIRSMYQAGLASELGGSLLLVGAILALGLSILAGDLTFAPAIVYIAVIRFMLKDFVRVSKAFATVNRFYAQLKKYKEFVTSAGQIPNSDYHEIGIKRGDMTIACSHLDSKVDSHSMVISEGAPFAVLSPKLSSKTLATALLEITDEKHRFGGIPPFTVGNTLFLNEAGLRFNLGLRDKADLEVLASNLRAFGCTDLAHRISKKGLDIGINKLSGDAVPEAAVTALNAIGAKLRGHRILLIEEKLLTRQTACWRQALLRISEGDFLGVIHNRVGSLPVVGEDQVVIHNGEEMIAWIEVPKTEEERHRLERTFAGITEAASFTRGSANEDDDALEDM